MLDIKFIRENPEIIRKDLIKRRKQDRIKKLEELLRKDKEWRSLKQQIDSLRQKRNIISMEVNELIKSKKSPESKINEAKEIPEKLNTLEINSNELKKAIDSLLLEIPNLIHKNVPSGDSEKDNKVIRKWGKPKKMPFELISHAELIERHGIADFETARKTSGQGFNYLTGELAMLDIALQRYGLDFMHKHGFRVVMPPMLLRHDTLLGALNGLQDFADVVYKLENEDLYLIGTAEHSLVSMNMDKVLDYKNLPVKITAATPCFRKEIGAHGVDTKGLFRMHQFNKVEQVMLSRPEESYKNMDYMLGLSEKFFKSLKIPFRVIEICSADLGAKFSKQYDIEAWFPRQKCYREVTSAGNCTDYQARALNIKFIDKDGEKRYVHILNNTMVATSRAMVAILENYQLKDGTVKVPAVLQKYMYGLKKMGSNLFKSSIRRR